MLSPAIGHSQCSALFSNQTSTVNDYTINFTNTSSGYVAGTHFYWNFNDGNYSSKFSPVHAFTNAGNYFVCLYLNDSLGNCKNIYCDSVTISTSSPGCQTNFLWKFEGDTAEFTSISTGVDSSTSFNWNFGDGTTSTDESAIHIYSQPGYKNVCLKLNNASCTDSGCKQVYLKPKYSCNAQYTKSIRKDTVSFFHTSYNPYALYYWTFGDNTTSTDENPIHVYKKNGTYSVCFQVTDTIAHCNKTYCDSVIITNLSCVTADFLYTTKDLSVDFTSLADTTADQFWWEFGDKANANTRDASHTYNSYGTFDGYYYIEDTLYNCSDRKDFKITLIQPKEFFNLSGRIHAGMDKIDYANVYIAKFDTTANTLAIVDTIQISPSDSGRFTFQNLAKGLHIVKASPQSVSKFVSNFAPAYFGGKAYWDSAILIKHDVDFDKADIELIPYLPMTGKDSLYGTSKFDNTIAAYADSPTVGMQVLLLDMNQKIVGCTYTKSEGWYKFKNLADGVYFLRPEWIGRESYIVQPPALGPLASCFRVNFRVSPLKVYPEKIITGIFTESQPLQIVCYPNPADNKLTVDILESLPIPELFNATGQLMHSPIERNGLSYIFDISGLATGCYFIRAANTSQSISFRKVLIIH